MERTLESGLSEEEKEEEREEGEEEGAEEYVPPPQVKVRLAGEECVGECGAGLPAAAGSVQLVS